MNYTIKTAKGSKYIVDLDKSGNRYVVTVWNKAKHLCDQIVYFDTYELALGKFTITCKHLKLDKFIKDVEHDPSDFNFD